MPLWIPRPPAHRAASPLSGSFSHERCGATSKHEMLCYPIAIVIALQSGGCQAGQPQIPDNHLAQAGSPDTTNPRQGNLAS